MVALDDNTVLVQFTRRVLELHELGYLDIDRASSELVRVATDNPSSESVRGHMQQMLNNVWRTLPTA